MFQIRGAVGVSALMLMSTPGWVAEPEAPAPEQTDAPLDEVVVSGEYPGPGLWKITRANDADHHVLWIVGDPPPIPKTPIQPPWLPASFAPHFPEAIFQRFASEGGR